MAKNSVEFWLKDANNVYLQLPVNPASVSISSPFGINTVKIASLGEVPIIGERGLKSLSFNSFFPRDYNASYCEYSGFMSPKEWVAQIEKWRDTRKNVRIIITGTDVSIPVFISGFDIEPERAGAPGDIYYSITLSEYKPVQAIKVVSTSATSLKSASTSRPATNATKSKTHTVVKGDSLSKIAKKYYGSISKWQTIYNANKTVIGKDSNLIYPGQKLVLP